MVGTSPFRWDDARSAAIATLLLHAALLAVPAAASPSAPVRIAVFDFELEDASAGDAIAGDASADDRYMKAVSAAVRDEVGKSDRYRIVDVAPADAQAVRDHSLRHCNGCDAGIALGLGADQSLIGVVRRITRTEYVVSFQLRDAKTGAMLASRQTDLRMGANYSWSRGATRLIKDALLEAPR